MRRSAKCEVQSRRRIAIVMMDICKHDIDRNCTVIRTYVHIKISLTIYSSAANVGNKHVFSIALNSLRSTIDLVSAQRVLSSSSSSALKVILPTPHRLAFSPISLDLQCDYSIFPYCPLHSNFSLDTHTLAYPYLGAVCGRSRRRRINKLWHRN